MASNLTSPHPHHTDKLHAAYLWLVPRSTVTLIPLLGGSLRPHSKNKTPVLGNAIPVLGMKLKRGVFW